MPQKCYYKPSRKEPRIFTPSDCGRIVANCKEQGFPDKQICAEIAEQAKLACEDCDCKRLKALVGAGVATLAILIAVRARNKAAMKEARAAIEKAMQSAREAEIASEIGLIEVLEGMQHALLILDTEELTMFEYDETTERLIEDWKDAQKTAFYPDADSGDGDTPIRIIDTGE